MEISISKFFSVQRAVALFVSLIMIISVFGCGYVSGAENCYGEEYVVTIVTGSDIPLSIGENNTADFCFSVREDNKYIFSWDLEEDCSVTLEKKTENEFCPTDSAEVVFSKNENKTVTYILDKDEVYRFTLVILSDKLFESESIAVKAVRYCRHENISVVGQENPTCVSGGYTKGTYCEDCQMWIRGHEEIEPLDHQLTEDYIIDKEPTCAENGSKSKHCIYCGTKTDVTVIFAKGHIMGEGEVTKAPSYLFPGIKTYRCTVCDKVLKKEKIKRLVEPSKEKKDELVKIMQLVAEKQGKKSINLTWDKVDAAEGYIVKYSIDGKLWGEVITEKNKVRIKGLKPGTKYLIKVVAYNGDFKGEESDIVISATETLKPGLKSAVSKKKKQVTLKWKRVSGATGYRVTYSLSKKFKKQKSINIKKVNRTKITIKKLRSNKKYFIRMRAYKTVNGKKLYSAYSKVRTVKVK